MLTVTSSGKVTGTSTSDRILDAAYDELLHFGVKGVSVEDIAKRCGVARVTVYRRFSNKDGLLGALALREGQRLFDQIDAAMAPGASREEQLIEGFAAIFQALREHPLVARILHREPEIATSFVSGQAAPIVAFARDFAAQRFAIDPAIAELFVRLTASFVLLPDSCIPLRTANEARAFARTHLVPMLPAGKAGK
jgi:AcrR family transcriptional regulator